MIYMGDSVLSPDGKFLWTGEEWIPAPPGQAQSTEEQVPSRGGEPSDIGESDGIDSPSYVDDSPPYVNHNPLSVPSVNRGADERAARHRLESGEMNAEETFDYENTILGLTSWVLGYNGAVLLIVIFTAYTYLKNPVDEPIPGWMISYDYMALKGLAVAWVIGIILTVYCRVSSVLVEDEVALKVIKNNQSISMVLLALPLLPIALIMLVFYLAMKYGNTGTRYH